MTTAEVVKSRKYTPQQVERALLALAVNGGNTSKTSPQVGVPQRTLHDWLTRLHADRYAEICRDHGRQIEDNIVNQTRELASLSFDAERLAIETTLTALGAGATKQASEASTALRNLSTSKGINLDKGFMLQGRPTVNISHRTLDEYLQDLTRRYPGAVSVIDSTAEDVTDTPALAGGC